MSPSLSTAMSQPCTNLTSFEREIEIGREKVLPESVDRVKYALFWPEPVKRVQQT
jgi:hypothetical protein